MELCQQRVYDLEMLEKEVLAAGLEVHKRGGYFLKPFSNNQMAHWQNELINAFYDVSKEVPAEFCAEIYIYLQNYNN